MEHAPLHPHHRSRGKAVTLAEGLGVVLLHLLLDMRLVFRFLVRHQVHLGVEHESYQDSSREPQVYCVVAVESVGPQTPIAFLDRVKDDFTKRYGGGKAAAAGAGSLNREFGSKLKKHMQYCVDNPEEINKLAKVKAQVSEVEGVMMENIEKVLDRGEKIELLVDKTENLRSQAQDFRQQGTQVRRKMWLQNMKIKLIVLGIIIALILIIILSVCHGFNCSK